MHNCLINDSSQLHEMW